MALSNGGPSTRGGGVLASALKNSFEAFTAEQVDAGGGVYGLHIASGEQARIAFAAWRKLKGR